MSAKRCLRIGLFAGTTEGRILAGWIGKNCKKGAVLADVFVATEYGKEEIPAADTIHVFCGRLDQDEIFQRLKENEYELVIDATHPYAKLVSENIKEACGKAGVRRIRVLREEKDRRNPKTGNGPRTVFVGSVKEAVEFLKGTGGPVLVTTGSKELSGYKELPGWEERIYARVLSLPQVVSDCADMGFYGSHLIAMQGPFSVEMNLALLNSVKAEWMVTKESGKAGGFEEKEEAAAKANAGFIVIGRPAEEGISLEEAVGELEKILEEAGNGYKKDRDKKLHVWLIGAGPGNTDFLTAAARRQLEGCDLIAGAGRIVDGLSEFGKPVLREYRPEAILEFIEKHPEYEKICVALSGDTGFYSGAKRLNEVLKGKPGTEVTVIPGISSVNYFFAKIGEAWEDACLISLHGRGGNLTRAVMENEKVFVLSGGKETLKQVCARLLEAGLTDVTLTVGENLSLPGERIRSGGPKELAAEETGSLAVILIKNPAWKSRESRVITHGLSDDSFLRERVPMTKMEVRTISVSKLRLTSNAVVYDVGAGTGSVSVECARLSEGIKVYAVERNPEAAELLRKNRAGFGLCNMEIIEGEAPGALEGLPAPTHVFIGGSGGRMKAVIEAVLLKNPRARFVINLITMESVAAVTEIIGSALVTDIDIIQLSSARAKKAGSSHLMMGQNPVWIVSFEGSGLCDGEKEEREQECLT